MWSLIKLWTCHLLVFVFFEERIFFKYGMKVLFLPLKKHKSAVLLRQQLKKCQLSSQIFQKIVVSSLLFLLSNLNEMFWRPNGNWIAKMNFLGNYFEIREHQCLFVLCFHNWGLMTNNWRFINCHPKRTLLNKQEADKWQVRNQVTFLWQTKRNGLLNNLINSLATLCWLRQYLHDGRVVDPE